MLTAKILNSDATLNNFEELGSCEFIPGEEKLVVLRLHDSQKDLRYIPLVTNITKVFFNKTDGTTLEKTGTHFADDRSIITLILQESESVDLLGGNFTFELDELGDASKITKGVVYNGLSKIITGSC